MVFPSVLAKSTSKTVKKSTKKGYRDTVQQQTQAVVCSNYDIDNIQSVSQSVL